MKAIILGIWLVIQGSIDFKYKEIPLWLSLLGGGIGLFFCVVEGRTVVDIAIACVPGIIALMFSWFTKEILGYGDGIVLVVMGIYMSLSRLLSIGMLAFGLAGVVALVLLVIVHKKGNYRMPFVPFLAIAYVLECVMVQGESML